MIFENVNQALIHKEFLEHTILHCGNQFEQTLVQLCLESENRVNREFFKIYFISKQLISYLFFLFQSRHVLQIVLERTIYLTNGRTEIASITYLFVLGRLLMLQDSLNDVRLSYGLIPILERCERLQKRNTKYDDLFLYEVRIYKSQLLYLKVLKIKISDIYLFLYLFIYLFCINQI